MEKPIEKIYTYADLLELGDNERAELIDGELYMMAPPTSIHQKISCEISRQIANFLTDKPCEIYPAPFGVRLFDKADDLIDESENYFEPDISVICDLSKIDYDGCAGAPDLVIEILSPSTAKHDRITKKKLYEKAGVREYWLVSPSEQTVDVFLLSENGKFGESIIYSREDTIKVTVLPGCEVDLSTVFPEIPVLQRKKK